MPYVRMTSAPASLAFSSCARHVDVLDVELLFGDRLDALGRQRLLEVGAAQLAVVGRVGQDRGLLEAAARDGLVHDHRRLDAVVRGVAEDVVLGLVVELVRQHRARGHVVHHGDLGFLEEALGREAHAGVRVADHGHDVFLVDELLGDLHAALVLGLVIAFDELDLPTKHTARLVDLVGGQLHAVAHADAHRRRAAGQRAVDADLDRVGREGSGGGRGGQGHDGEAGCELHEVVSVWASCRCLALVIHSESNSWTIVVPL